MGMVPVDKLSNGEEFRLPSIWTSVESSGPEITIPSEGLYAVRLLHSSASNYNGLIRASLNGIEIFRSSERDRRLDPLVIGDYASHLCGAAILLFIRATKVESGYELQEQLTGVSFGTSSKISIDAPYGIGSVSLEIKRAQE